MRLKTPSKGAFRNIGAAVAHWASVEPSVASETWYPESQTCIAAHPSRRPLRGLLRMRSNLLKTQPHAEERATRASRSMGNKRLTYLLESVRRVQAGLHSFLSMRRIEARRKNASAFRLRFSQSLASLRQRLSHAMVRSTIQRFGKTTNPLT